MQLIRELIFLNLISFLPRFYYDQLIRTFLLRCAGLNIGNNVKIKAGIVIEPFGKSNNIVIGKNVFINTCCRLASKGKITIGNNCSIGPNVSFETVNHKHDNKGKIITNFYDITVKNNVWVGSGVIILPGVTIGENCIISAGSVVTRSVEKNSLVAGVPAKLIRKI